MPQHGRREGRSPFPAWENPIDGRPEVSAGIVSRKPPTAKPIKTEDEARTGAGDQHRVLIKQIVDTEIRRYADQQ
jgi:hypothetical protein